MLEVTSQVNKGIMFIRLEGELTDSNFYKVADFINYLLYKQGILSYVFNLEGVNVVDCRLFNRIQNKLTEIFLSCGSVAFCGVPKALKKLLWERREQLFYVMNEREVFQYISL